MSPLVKVLNRATIRRDRALIAVSDAAYARTSPCAADAGPGRGPRCRPLGVPCRRRPAREIRGAVRAELGVPPDELLVVTVANLRSEKGYDVLLEAAHLLAANAACPSGSRRPAKEPLEEELAATRRRLGLGDRFRFLGHRDDVRGAADRGRRRRPSLPPGRPPGRPDGGGQRRCDDRRHRGRRACPRSSPTGSTACWCRRADPDVVAEALERLVGRPRASRPTR